MRSKREIAVGEGDVGESEGAELDALWREKFEGQNRILPRQGGWEAGG